MTDQQDTPSNKPNKRNKHPRDWWGPQNPDTFPTELRELIAILVDPTLDTAPRERIKEYGDKHRAGSARYQIQRYLLSIERTSADRFAKQRQEVADFRRLYVVQVRGTALVLHPRSDHANVEGFSDLLSEALSEARNGPAPTPAAESPAAPTNEQTEASDPYENVFLKELPQ